MTHQFKYPQDAHYSHQSDDFARLANDLEVLQALEEVLGRDVFNDKVKAAITEGYFFLADIFINVEKEKK